MTRSETPSPSEPTEDKLAGHEYDGIQEYDNPMPTWWRRTFWLSFWFAVAYYVHFQLTGNGPSAAESYAEDMRSYREFLAAQSMGEEMTEESLTTLMADPLMMKDARSVFLTRCLQCHADRGQGNIGPNLTDDHWIYGSSSLMDIYEIVSNGRPLKGMPAWSRTLRPVELGQIVAYVGTLRGTNVPGRPPQGKKVSPPPPAGAPEPAESPEPEAAITGNEASPLPAGTTAAPTAVQ